MNIDGHLLAEVKQIAARGNRTIGSVLEDALRRMLAETASVPPETPFALPTHGAGGLRQGVDLEDKESMADALNDNAPV